MMDSWHADPFQLGIKQIEYLLQSYLEQTLTVFLGPNSIHPAQAHMEPACAVAPIDVGLAKKKPAVVALSGGKKKVVGG